MMSARFPEQECSERAAVGAMRTRRSSPRLPQTVAEVNTQQYERKKHSMKKLTIGILTGIALLTAVAGGVMAANTQDQVTVSVASVQDLTVPVSTAIMLTHDLEASGASYDQATVHGDKISLLHNYSSAKHVSVAATVADEKVSDITLKVQMAGDAVTLVNSGSTSEQGGTFTTGFANGDGDKDITWIADATLSGTSYDAEGYKFNVSFTVAD
jgi:hypothetical protein